MERGKEICRILKDIRKKIADENGIEFEITECTHKGDCAGTCPKCESELHYLESQLARRHSAGRMPRLAGLSLGLAAVAPALISCEMTTMGDPVLPLEGDSDSPELEDGIHLSEGIKITPISAEDFRYWFSKGGWQETEIYDVYPDGSVGEEILSRVNGYDPMRFAAVDGDEVRMYNKSETLAYSYYDGGNNLRIGTSEFIVESINEEQMVCYSQVFSLQWAPEAFMGKYVFRHVDDDTVAQWGE